MRRPNKEIQLTSYDDLLGINSETVIEKDTEQIKTVPLEELYDFKDHPFRVVDDEKMEETTASIAEYGVLVPGIARPRAEGGYELIAGHRRKHGSQRAGRKDMPVIIRNYSDDEATIIMVDTNIQREDILPSEKARAYRMKYEALKHQGIKGDGSTLEKVGEKAGDSAKTVQRYIQLSRLIDELLELVDSKKLGFVQGTELALLDEEQQRLVLTTITELNRSMTKTQAATIKEYGKKGELTRAVIEVILNQNAPKERKVVLKPKMIKNYFSDDVSEEEIENIIVQLLEEWKDRRGDE